MYTSELINNNKKELGYDLKDDLVFFMNNDPTFYRKKYFPAMIKFNEYVKEGKIIRPSGLKPLVDEAYKIYKEKFPVEGLEQTLEAEMCESICEFIHEQEMKNCKEGLYDEEK